MTDCGVCLMGDFDACDGYIDAVSLVVLDHAQKCSECNKTVPSGLTIEQADWFDDVSDDTIYTCLICAEIADAFYCDGRMYGGGLWESMMYEVMDQLNSSCFDKLKTPEAKQELRRRWMEWKGLTK